MRAWCAYVLCGCANGVDFRNDERNRIYTPGRENSLRKGFPRICVFVIPLTFRRFALSSAGSSSASVTALALDSDREGTSAVAALPDTRGGGGGGGASSSSSSEGPVGP